MEELLHSGKGLLDVCVGAYVSVCVCVLVRFSISERVIVKGVMCILSVSISVGLVRCENGPVFDAWRERRAEICRYQEGRQP